MESLSAATFADRAFAALDEVPDDENLHMRLGGVKNLTEEILPLALFAKYFDAPERRAHCRYLGASDAEADGELSLSGRAVDLGFYPRRVLVEITCAEDSKAYLRREALARHGAVFTGMDIERIGRRGDSGSSVVSRVVVREGDSGISEMAGLVRAAVERKVRKNYSPKRLLLVRLDPDFALTHTKVCAVAAQSRDGQVSDAFLAVFLVECSTACVFQAY